jgi:hypothetical protein
MNILEASFSYKDVTKHKTLRDNLKPVVPVVIFEYHTFLYPKVPYCLHVKFHLENG